MTVAKVAASCRTTDQPGASIDILELNGAEDCVYMKDHLPANENVPRLLATQGDQMRDQKIVFVQDDVKLGFQVSPTQFIVFPSLGISAVTVWLPEKAIPISTSSCGSGTRDVHAFVDQFPLTVHDQV